jgi:hypothetical protein
MVPSLAFLFACASNVGGDNLSKDGSSVDTGVDPGDDLEAPAIDFVPLDSNQPSGFDVVLSATIIDEGTGVFTATLYFWNETDSPSDKSKIAFLDQGNDLWQATIGADEQHSSGMWYYVSAIDRAQNESFSPEDGGDSPYHFGYSD